MQTRFDYLASAGGILGGLAGVVLVCLIVASTAAVSPVLCLLLSIGLVSGTLFGAYIGIKEVELYFQLGAYSEKGTISDRIEGALFGVGIGGFPVGLLIPALTIVGIFLALLLDEAICALEERFS